MRVFSNSAISLDGRLAPPGGAAVMLGSAEDRRQMSRLRAQADAVLVGGQTFRAWPRPLIEHPARLPWPHHRTQPILNAVLTRTGLLSAASQHFPDPRVEMLVLGPPSLDVSAHQAHLGAQVIQTADPSVRWALEVLQARGCRAVLVEGGGSLIAALLEADLLDELFVTLCPTLLGAAQTPGLIPGALSRRTLVLRSCRVVEDELFLHYQVRPRTADRDHADSLL